MLFSTGTQAEKQGSKWFESLLNFRRHNYSSNLYYASFVLTKDATEELNQKYDGISCVTVVTVITGSTFYTQHTRLNLLE